MLFLLLSFKGGLIIRLIILLWTCMAPKDLHTFIRAINTIVGLIGSEGILRVGKNINAIGSGFKNVILEIQSDNDLPYFLTKMTKDQMEVDRNNQSKLSDDANAGHKQLCLICFMKTRTRAFGCGLTFLAINVPS
ncbi:hypothetical protein Pint_29551 [Pistacia integerrima]|uniref:Uncharacterized protein n=1 Tax=Pistacia integerrima TaxID=434235 RepID=A0ACC0WZV3_9ROSI|nr:hypothetical protein Pint_29551 [Pistacia integerrima]